MATQASARKVAWWKFPGYWATLAGAIQGFMGYGFMLYAWSAFIPLFGKEFGWSAAVLGATGSVLRFLQIPLSPLGGWLTDRIGPRLNGILTTVFMGVGWFLLTLIDSPLWLYIVYGVVMNLGYNGGLYKVSYPAVNRFFVRLRARGIGLVTLGAGFGGTVLVPVTAVLLEAYGWRTTAMIIGFSVLAVGILTSFLFISHPPEHYGLYPDNETPEETERKAAELRARGRARAAATGLVDYTQGQILRTPAYWFLVVAGTAAVLGAAPLPLFQNLRLQQVGYSLTEAAAFYSLNFIFTLVGRGSVALLGDWLAERISIRVTMCVCLFLQSIGILLFALALNNYFVVGWAALHGVGYGAWIPLSGQIMGAYFGRRAMGFAYGLWLGLTGITGSLSPFVFGWLRDTTGDWVLPFMVGVVAFAVGAVTYLGAVQPKPREAS